MHQSIVRPSRSLAPRRYHRPNLRRRPLSLLRRLPAHRSPAAQPPLPHAPAPAHGPPASPPSPAVTAERLFRQPQRLVGNFSASSASISEATRHSSSRPQPAAPPRCIMTGFPSRSSWPKRILLSIAGLVAFLLLFVIALRITVSEMYRGGGIESSRATGLSAPSWDERSMWSSAPMLQKSMPVDFARVAPWESSIAR